MFLARNSFMTKTAAAGGYQLWSWGGNTDGVLGLGNTTAYSSPKQVGALQTWTGVFCCYNSCFASKSNGEI